MMSNYTSQCLSSLCKPYTVNTVNKSQLSALTSGFHQLPDRVEATLPPAARWLVP